MKKNWALPFVGVCDKLSNRGGKENETCKKFYERTYVRLWVREERFGVDVCREHMYIRSILVAFYTRKLVFVQISLIWKFERVGRIHVTSEISIWPRIADHPHRDETSKTELDVLISQVFQNLILPQYEFFLLFCEKSFVRGTFLLWKAEKTPEN